MENGHEVEDFRQKSILTICMAGSDRSRYVAEELNNRGYFANSAGVMANHNYVTCEDLYGIGTIVFASIHEKKIFDKDKHLKNYISRNGIEVRVLNITESDKNRAHDSGSVDKLKAEIAKQLDYVGLKEVNPRS